MWAGDPESYLLSSRMQEGISAIGIQGYVKYTSLCTIKYI